MKIRITTLLFALLLFCGPLAAQLRLSILGDSYSTYGGYMTPATNLCWYNGPDGADKENDVEAVEQTWWWLFAHEHGMQIECNNSYSGSTVCHTGYRGQDFSDRSFITRVHRLGTPDILLVFGGTNDSWARVPIGDYRHGGWTKEELYNFRPAFSYLMHQLRELYPRTLIYNITNSELSPQVTGSMDTICRYYGIVNVQLHDIDKQHGHPSQQGMQSISRQLWEAVSRDIAPVATKNEQQ